MKCPACEIEGRMTNAWAQIDGRKEPAHGECTHCPPAEVSDDFVESIARARKAIRDLRPHRDEELTPAPYLPYGADAVPELTNPIPGHSRWEREEEDAGNWDDGQETVSLRADK